MILSSKTKFIFSLLALAASLSYAPKSLAALHSAEVDALYKSRDGKDAKVVVNGNEITVPVTRIQNLEKARTGTKIRVLLYPAEMGLPSAPKPKSPSK